MITFDDLADRAGILRAISELTNANQHYGEVAVSTNERIKQSVIGLQKEVANYQQLIQSIKNPKEVFGLKDDVIATTSALKNQSAVLAQNKSVVESNNAVLARMKDRLSELQKEYDKLDLSQKNDIKRKKEIERELTQTTRALTALTTATAVATKASQSAQRSYNELDKQTKQLRADLRAMSDAFDDTGAINKYNRAAVELQKQIDKNSKALLNADRAMGVSNRNVGNYSSALKGIAGDLTGVTSVATGVSLAIHGISAAFEIIQNMERAESGLKAASRDSADFSRSQQFLIELADKLGVKYLDLIDNYKGLKAATKDTVLEGRATEKIFTAVATAGAKLGLSNEDVTGTLRALTQMISKGKISAEELRGQLGERLPSAIRLMSEALGVSESKLNKMMEQGELIATEVMPKFANELDKAFGLKQNEKIDRLGSSVDRLKNEFAYLLKAFNDNTGVTNFFKAISDGLANSLGDIRRWLQDGSVIELITFFGAGSLSRRNQSRRNEEVTQASFAKMNLDERKNKLKELYNEAKKAEESGEVDRFNEIVHLRRKLERDNLKLEVKERREAQQQATIAEKQGIEKDEADLARFQKQSVRKRTAELIALEKQLKSDPKNQVLEKKLAVYTRLDAEQKAKDKAVSDRLKKGEGNTLSDKLAYSKAVTDDKLTRLGVDRQDGLISEQAYIEDRLKITLDGLNKRAAILEKAGKKETDDYINIQKEKKKADLDYSRSQLQLDLKSNKGKTDSSLAGLDRQHSEGDLSDLSYVDKRHDLIVAGIKRDQVTLKEAGQEQTELFKATNAALEQEQTDYLDKRLNVEKKAWKDALQLTKESLSAIDKETSVSYETELSKIHTFYNDQRNVIQLSVAQGKLSENEGNQLLAILDQNELKDELTAYKAFVDKAKQLTHEFINDRIEQLKNWIAYSGASQKELAEAQKQIDALEKQQRESDAEDAIKLQNVVADNDIKSSDKAYQAKKRNADKEKADRQEILALATKPVDGGFNIPGLQDSATAIMAIYSQISNHKEKLAAKEKMTADERKAAELDDLKEIAQAAATIGLSIVNTSYQLQQQRTTQQLAEIDKREQYELESVGSNESAKAAIQKRYDNERKQIQRKQAEAERNRAMFEIFINTAVAVVKALPNIPLSILVGALGAASLIATATKPLPQYYTGKNIDGITNDNYSGPALVGERGREIWQHDGVAELVDKPSILNVGQNDRVLPNWMTEQVLEGSAITTQTARQMSANRQLGRNREAYQVRRLAGAVNWDTFPVKRLADAIGEANKSLPFTSHIFDGKGYTFAIVDEVKHQVLKDLNKSFSFKRR